MMNTEDDVDIDGVVAVVDNNGIDKQLDMSKLTIGNQNQSKFSIDSHNKSITNPIGQAFIYTRTSTLKKDAVSLDVQLNSIVQYCKQGHLRITGVYTDAGRSAKNMEKLHELNKLVKDITNDNFEYENNNDKYLLKSFIAYDVSRFSRNFTQALNIINKMCNSEINIYFLQENISYAGSYNKHMVHNYLSNAQFHSEQVSEKVKSAIKHKRSLGHHIGGRTKYGYKREGHMLVREPKEAKIIKFIYALKQAGEHAYTIASIINSKNNTFRGKPFTPSNVKILLGRANEFLN